MKNNRASESPLNRNKDGSLPPLLSKRSHRIDRRRYRHLKRFFAKVLLQSFWWDVIFTLPALRWFRSPPLNRWKDVARQYRELAAHMGGILIKLGQFLSTRVDLFPVEVTQELAGLQDDVPPDPHKEIVRVVEQTFGRPIGTLFLHLDPVAVGSASLAQAHQAVLPDGQWVVVKVLRPHIFSIVETDLAALRLVCKWLKRFKHINERMDLDRLFQEFAATTWNELDLTIEKENIRRFAKNFAFNPNVIVPKIYEAYCASRALTLENVGYIKISDTDAMEACGISCPQVADLLYDIYMHQIFVDNLVHVDPHPGNLFVKPLPLPEEIRAGITGYAPGAVAPYAEERPFQLIFIDFGMIAEISERLKAAMRLGAIGVGTQDARKIIQAYVMAGALRPGADLRRLEEAHQEWLQKAWGLRLGSLHETARREIRYFMHEYRDLITETPFHIQADMLFISRAVGILAGLTNTIDPHFDPWSKTLTYAKHFAKEELTSDWQGLWEEIFIVGKNIWRLPSRMEQLLTRANQGALAVQVSLSRDTRKAIRRIDLSVRRFAWMVITAGLLVSGVNMHIAGKDRPYGIILIILSVLAFLWGIRK
jgi:predicted unusual protein kinase regulating ubiquinone biosynthesis (AarF/ABC1/UbiB family)